MTFDLALLTDNGHLVYQGQWHQEVAKIHKRPAEGEDWT